MQKRLALFLVLSAAIFISWQFLAERFFPPAKPDRNLIVPTPSPSAVPTAAGASDSANRSQSNPSTNILPATNIEPIYIAQIAQEEARSLRIITSYWVGVLSNQGAVLTSYTLTHLPNGKPIDPETGGVNLVSPQKSQEIGAPFRLLIPSEPALEKELNSARYHLSESYQNDLNISPSQSQTISFSYRNQAGIIASKSFVFRGTGYSFDLTVNVSRNGQPVEAYIVIGPDFGDQSIREYGYYKPPPHATYVANSSVERHAAGDLKVNPQIINGGVRWAAVDDNYFAMAFVPPTLVSSVRLINDQTRIRVSEKEEIRNHISVAIPVANDKVNHIYAGPKDINILAQVSRDFSLAELNLEYLVSYGWSFVTPVVKPIAHFMLSALMFIYKWTHNYGWAIIIFTVALNMLFFPLRWKSSVSMKRAAALQPRMKELQERMRKLDKNDPRMVDLQKEQVALMREGNPLMGCLPLLLQMPFFWAVFVILTVTVEMRHAGFIGWVKDLSSPDPYYLLPIIFVISMIVQQALTPTTADPVQKKVQYLMPLMMGYFFIHAPAGLVLYWMVGNLVGIAQQFVINKITPPISPSTTNGNGGKTPRRSKEALARS